MTVLQAVLLCLLGFLIFDFIELLFIDGHKAFFHLIGGIFVFAVLGFVLILA